MSGMAGKFIRVTGGNGAVYLNVEHIVSIECYRNRYESQPESNLKFTMDNNKEFVDVFDCNDEYDEFVSTVLAVMTN